MAIVQEQSRKVTLPGSMFERAGQWWWRVRLPGEDAVQTHLLEAAGAATAACGPEAAEKAAIRMWEQAIAREATSRITLDCMQKVEQFKAQFLDKLGRLTESVESATVKARAEADARAKIESRLNAIIHAAGLGPGEAGGNTTVRMPDGWDLSADSQAATPYPTAIEDDRTQSEAGPCECCGRTGIPATDFTQIDSGQWLCPDCLHTLRVNALQAELDTLTESLA